MRSALLAAALLGSLASSSPLSRRREQLYDHVSVWNVPDCSGDALAQTDSLYDRVALHFRYSTNSPSIPVFSFSIDRTLNDDEKLRFWHGDAGSDSDVIADFVGQTGSAGCHTLSSGSDGIMFLKL